MEILKGTEGEAEQEVRDRGGEGTGKDVPGGPDVCWGFCSLLILLHPLGPDPGPVDIHL